MRYDLPLTAADEMAAVFFRLQGANFGFWGEAAILAVEEQMGCDGIFRCQRVYFVHAVLKGGGALVVYLDGIMGLNFLVDLMLLLGVNRLAGYPAGLGRAVAAAAVGGGYAGMCLVPSFSFLGSNLWRMVSLGLMSAAAFGLSRSAVSRGTLFVLLSMALGGLVISFDSGSVIGLLLCAAGLALLCQVGFRASPGNRELLPVTIRCRGREARFLALRDTGNTLRDSLTGEAVLVVNAKIGQKLLGIGKMELGDPVGVISSGIVPGARLIPYQTVGARGTFLLAVRCEEVCVAGKKTGGLVAFGAEEFGNGEYQGLTGGQNG